MHFLVLDEMFYLNINITFKVFQKEQPKRGKQEEGDDFSGENNINKEYKFNKCRKFIMIAGEHDGKIGGTGPCFHKVRNT